MEQSSSRLYVGPLSQAALKVLAALRAQNLHEGGCNQRSSRDHRQMERCNYSHVESWTPSCCSQMESRDSWPQGLFSITDHSSTNDTQTHQTTANCQAASGLDSSLQKKTLEVLPDHQCFQTYSHILCLEPPAYLSRQALSFSQETETDFCQQETFSVSLQLPKTLSDHQTAPCSSSAGILKPAFMFNNYSGDKVSDEMFASTTEQPESHSVACHTLLPCSDKRKETVNSSSARIRDDALWDISANEAEGLVPSGSGEKWTQSVSNPSEEAAGVVDEHQHSELNTTKAKRGHQPLVGFVTKDMGQPVAGIAERELLQGALVQSEDTKFILEDNNAHNLERFGLIAVAVESRTAADNEEHRECNVDPKQLSCFDTQDTDIHRLKTDAQQLEEIRPVPKSVEGSDGERGLVPTPSLDYGACRSWFRSPYCPGNQQHHTCLQTYSKSGLLPIPERRQNSSLELEKTITTSALDKELYTKQLTSEIRSDHPPLTPSFPRKRKYDVFQHQFVNPHLKSYKTICPPKWEPPRPSQRTVAEGGVSELKKIRRQPSVSGCPESSEEQQQTQIKITPCETQLMFKIHTESHVLKQTQPISLKKVEKSSNEMARIAPKQKPFAKLCKHRLAKLRVSSAMDGPKGFYEVVATSELQTQSKTGLQPAALASDARVKDSGKLNSEERVQMLEEVWQAEVVVVTMMFRDGTTQLDAEQKLTPSVCGLLVLMKNDRCCAPPRCSLGLNDSLVYLKLEHNPPWAQQQIQHTQQLFTRDVLLRILSRSQLVVCYKAKDFLRTVLLYYKQDLSWKEVAGCQIQDPQVSGWLLDPTDPSSCFNELLNKHSKRPCATPSLGPDKVSQIISSLYRLYEFNLTLCSKLQSQGLWELYSEMELKMITVLGVMESHCICVDKGELKRTSDLLGTKIKQLEQEAHKAAGQIFMVTSNAQLRAVLFEKLRLHELCENKKLPKTISKQQQSTSEAALLQLQHLHPLPKIILEYRQVHKIKSTFVDGILSCVKSKNYISSKWYQTSAVTGRISAKHPNFQALPRQPLQIRKKQCIQGKEEDVVTVHPRDMFIPQEGWTFLAADFCQVELRLLAHFSSDPELLRIFTNPQADVFTMLASQWS
ncbi:uncharacterized protein LOC124880916 isoform X4 [Girardinichthys multiradiatus]|uniref:uncharacterized protein LOC124880916 isoform X4 n=1 Tax=Girardinichthys multiradiatus TaxID=208333 RepID=UPI001FADA1C8|nr:uncharacterized protein LOC124880916 isoform X4 [Girardinichthys multiradiatus]